MGKTDRWIDGRHFFASGPKHRRKATAQRMAKRARTMSFRRVRVVHVKGGWRVFVGPRRLR